MRQYWFKVYSPEHDETRILWMNIPEGDDIHIFEQLKNDVKLYIYIYLHIVSVYKSPNLFIYF